MPYPSLEEYQEALHSPKLVLSDPELKNGTVSKNGLGLPFALCGGFALTYTLTCGRNKYAVRCFHKKSDSLEQRYAAISKKLHSLSIDYFVNFEFQPRGIRVNNSLYPVVKMEWGAGETLGEFVESNFNNREALLKLKQSIVSLSSYLFRNGIAHGDIQPGNAMISNAGSKLQLIDYDGMFVEEIKSLGNSEIGHRNFQHPRRQSHFDQFLDRFSLISIYLSLQALEIDKQLWDRTKSDGDTFLFRANDFINPTSSSVFSSLISKQPILQQVKNFAAICQSPYEEVPSLEDFIACRNIPQITISISTQPIIDVIQKYISQYAVLDANNYSLCLKYVGDRVELIGRVVEVKQDVTRYGKPYVFINFGPWQGQIVKVTIWSEGLAKLRNRPSESWIGKWISVTGLIDPPYTNTRKKYRYTHLSVTISDNNQLHIIDENEAKYRLNLSHDSTRQESRYNERILQKMGMGSKRSDSRKVSTVPVSQNQKILQQMQPRTQRVATHTPPPQSSHGVPSKSSDRYGCLVMIIVAIVIIILLRTCH
jgi:serine/threonine protein kinase